MSEFAVSVEDSRGAVTTLRRRFTLLDAAEEWAGRVTQSGLYRRAWAGRVTPSGAPSKPRPPRDIEACFAALERAAASSERCPFNGTHGVDSTATTALARAGRIRVAVYRLNWRVVTILTGPQAGKATAAPPGSYGPPHLTISKDGKVRS